MLSIATSAWSFGIHFHTPSLHMLRNTDNGKLGKTAHSTHRYVKSNGLGPGWLNGRLHIFWYSLCIIRWDSSHTVDCGKSHFSMINCGNKLWRSSNLLTPLSQKCFQIEFSMIFCYIHVFAERDIACARILKIDTYSESSLSWLHLKVGRPFPLWLLISTSSSRIISTFIFAAIWCCSYHFLTNHRSRAM